MTQPAMKAKAAGNVTCVVCDPGGGAAVALLAGIIGGSPVAQERTRLAGFWPAIGEIIPTG